MENKTINLNRMQKLLDGFSGDKDGITLNSDIDTNTDTKIDTTINKNSITNLFKNFKIQNNPNDINIDFKDLNAALNIEGRVGGYTNITDIKYLYDDIIQNIPKIDLVNAKSIVSLYFVNPNVSMFSISDVMEKLSDTASDATILFATSTTELLKSNEIGYRIILTGIKDDSLDLKYHKQLVHENNILKNKIDELQNEVIKLESQKDRLEFSLLSLGGKYL